MVAILIVVYCGNVRPELGQLPLALQFLSFVLLPIGGFNPSPLYPVHPDQHIIPSLASSIHCSEYSWLVDVLNYRASDHQACIPNTKVMHKKPKTVSVS